MCGFELSLVWAFITYLWMLTGDLQGAVDFFVSNACG